MTHPNLKSALNIENPLQIVGTINAYTALLAEKVGIKAIYLSGAGVSNASLGIPDLGISNLGDVLTDVHRITDVCSLPLLVDIDTGWGSAFNIQRTIKSMIKAGAAGVHLEDQAQAKRCGHRPKKILVSQDEMCDRLKAALDAKTRDDFVIMARTDALAIEGLDKTLERIIAYTEIGAEMIFLEGATELSQYKEVSEVVKTPLLANITEFGVSPLFTKKDLAEVGVQLILYPLSAFRAMSFATLKTYQTILKQGTQTSLLTEMQTREALYDILHYYDYEKKLDELFEKGIET